MIHPESLTLKWIRGCVKANNNADPILIEKVVRALLLLEGLKGSGLDFIFKGGTALMLLQPEMKRLSIDIDIILDKMPDNLAQLFHKITVEKGFSRFIEQERKSMLKIEKAHYKFFYAPITSSYAKEENILLDIVIQKNPYGALLNEVEINCPLIKLDGNPMKVKIPTVEAILGDKLTAYAPNTTGIKYYSGKQIHIIKQLYDIGNLFENVNNITDVKTVFETIVEIEIQYRELDHVPIDMIIEDIYQTSLCLSLRGEDGKGDFKELQTGIHNIVNFIISESFQTEKAIILASKAAYLSALLRNNISEIKRYKSPSDIFEMVIESPFNTKLNKLKKSNPEGFFYWYHATAILKK